MSRQRKNQPGDWLRQHLTLLRTLILVALMLLASMYSIAWNFQRQHRSDPLQLGVSFSIKYSKALGNDWKQNFLALVDDLNVKKMRLMSYWDLIEPSEGNYDFTDLDWQIAQAEAHHVDVTLAIGQRQPRWPECHIPSWAAERKGSAYQASVLAMLQTVVSRYKDSPAIETWQLENENANRHFGVCDQFDNSFLDEELAVVQAADPGQPVAINASNQSGVPLRQPVGVYTGFSIYRSAHFDALSQTWGWSFWYVPSWWHSFRAGLVEGIHDTQAFIHELQTEPWGPRETQFLSREEQDASMNSTKILNMIAFAKQTGMKEIYLWGGEWWYWRLNQFNDRQLWDTMRAVYRD